MIESVLGSYYAPYKNTIVNEDRRAEDERRTSDLDRQGSRVCVANEPIAAVDEFNIEE